MTPLHSRAWPWTTAILTLAAACLHVPKTASFLLPSSGLAVTNPHFKTSSSLEAAPNYIRWNTVPTNDNDQTWELQTAVTTFERINKGRRDTVELHAQVHYGTEQYFDYYNSVEFQDRHDHVLYELLVDEELLQYHSKSQLWTLEQPLVPSPSDQAVAQQYGWKCQVDVIDYHNPQQQQKGRPPKWCHADWTRQELMQQKEQQQQKEQEKEEITTHQSPLATILQDKKSTNNNNQQLPLWQQVTTGSAFWQPAMAALWVGPPSITTTRNTRKKLFTNLFLPGNSLAAWLRALLWITVPAPEVSVLLLDWSSLWLTTSSSNDNTRRRRNEAPTKLSDVTIPILQALMTLRLAELRQLVFGQVLMAGNSGGAARNLDQNDNDWKLLVTQRNDRALQVLASAFNNNVKAKSMALLYGCSHCSDLHTKLVRDLGFVPLKTEWRTAWSVTVPSTFVGGVSAKSDDDSTSSLAELPLAEAIQVSAQTTLPQTALAALLVLLPLYCWLGAIDWVDTIQSSAVSLLEDHDRLTFGTEWGLYLVRHVLLYVGISKFVLEWNQQKE